MPPRKCPFPDPPCLTTISSDCSKAALVERSPRRPITRCQSSQYFFCTSTCCGMILLWTSATSVRGRSKLVRIWQPSRDPRTLCNTGTSHAELASEVPLRNSLSWRANFSPGDGVPSASGTPNVAATAGRRTAIHCAHLWPYLWVVFRQQPHDPFTPRVGTR